LPALFVVGISSFGGPEFDAGKSTCLSNASSTVKD